MPSVHRGTPDERARVADALAVALAGELAVEFAYLHGSFVEDRPFRDIDIAVMLSEDAQSDATGAALDIGDRLERIVEHPVDVRALNHAPLTFQFKAARGRLLVCRDEGRLALFIEHILPRYFDLAPRLLRATREAFGP